MDSSACAGYDLVVDGADNFPTRYLLNDAALKLGKPVVHASIFRFEGQLTTFLPFDGPCYRCLYPEPPPPGMAPSCQEAGVLGVLPGIIGTMQKFRPAYERRLRSLDFEPAFDLDQALAAARQMTGRDDPGAHFGLQAGPIGEQA